MTGLLSRRFLMVVLLCLLGFSSAFPYKKIKVFVIETPDQVLPGVKQIAVLDFEGENDLGRNFADYMISQLLVSDRGITEISGGLFRSNKEGRTLQDGAFTNVFNVIERSRMMEVVEEQKLGAMGLLDASQAAQLGQILGVQALVMGNISYTHKDNRFQEKRTYRGKDKKTYTKLVPCLERTVTVTVRARIISAENGQIVGVKEASRSNTDKKCEADIGNVTPLEQMADDLARSVSNEVVDYLAPRFVLEEFEFEKLKADDFKDVGDDAAEMAENLDVDGAYAIYKTIYDEDPYNPKVMYNLGILEEVVGNFDAAKGYYEMATQLKSDEKKYTKSLDRLDKKLAYLEQLSQLGVELAGREWSQKKVDLSEQKVEIKGGSDERFPIYQQPQEGSTVVAQVPGGLLFKVLAVEGDWYLIELLGGKSGYVHKDRAKIK